MQISRRISRARVSGTVKLGQMARELQAAGRDVIDLAEGEPDFDTAPHIVAAAHQAALAGQTRYTSVGGTNELRVAVSDYFARRVGLRYPPEQIIVGTGAKQLIFNALLTTVNAGDQVIIPAPYWVSYPDMVKIADGTPLVVPCKAADGYKLTAAQLRQFINERTRWLILNSPCNPTGAVYNAQELQALAEILGDYPDVGIISDDIYQHILFDDARPATIASVAPELAARTLTVDGVSKTYAMTGWRIGFAGGPPDLIDAMTKLQGQSTTNASSVSQAAALAALQGPQDYLDAQLLSYVRRRDLVLDFLNRIDGLKAVRPAGAFYVFIDCSAYFGHTTDQGDSITTDHDMAMHLLNQAGVALVPGTEFGAPGHLRLCFAKADSQLSESCKRIEATLGRLRG